MDDLANTVGLAAASMNEDHALSNFHFTLEALNEIPFLVRTCVNSLHVDTDLNSGLQRGHLVVSYGG